MAECIGRGRIGHDLGKADLLAITGVAFHLSGNAVLYRRALVELIGVEKVEWLEGPHEPKKYTIDDLKAIKAEYIRKRKEIEA